MQTVVVTGASRGIGAAVVRAFAAEGARVVACARDAETLAAATEDVREAGGTVTALRGDVRDEFDVERVMETAAREGDAIDVVVANAGIYHGAPGETPISCESYASFDDSVRVNGRGVFATIREAVPHLADDARVLVPSGRVAREPTAGYGAYAVSKALGEAVVRQFATDLDRTVGVVDPGDVATDLSGEDGRDPDAVAPLFVWAATDAPAEKLDGAVLDLSAWRSATEEPDRRS